MNDLISRQAAIDAADYADCARLAIEDVKKVTDEVVKELKQIPIADAVEVVRCKDCKHLKGNNGHDRPWCGLTEWMQNPITKRLDDYCSHGERREDEQIH